ncbi:MAG: 2-amino-4-hydroxy-6-hydroxymethyldihydropteridine diphosphokinase [Phycisphaerales bacterium]|nr:2-amino-4-hydroxy-6-hydroxymethyldihydropteridine diphosphokinase [Hyphomonadaceae bacterium]
MHASAFIAMGTNMPFNGAEGPTLLAQALSAMREAGFMLRAASGVWRTPAWPPGADQPDYFNAVVEVDAKLSEPQAAYAQMRTIEAQFGRARRTKWESRTLDLDLLAVGDLQGAFGEIILPHPHIHERAFVLAPMAEIAPDWRHPSLGLAVSEMLAALDLSEGYRRVSALKLDRG